MSTKPADQKILNLEPAASAEDGDVVMASQLLSLGADPMGGHAECLLLRLAAKNGHAECVTLLIPTSQFLSLNSEPLILSSMQLTTATPTSFPLCLSTIPPFALFWRFDKCGRGRRASDMISSPLFSHPSWNSEPFATALAGIQAAAPQPYVYDAMPGLENRKTQALLI